LMAVFQTDLQVPVVHLLVKTKIGNKGETHGRAQDPTE
jgi:hypothetical protein